MISVFVAGDSHYASVASALGERGCDRVRPDSSGIHVHVFNAWKHSLAYQFSVAQDGRWVLNPQLKSEIDQLSEGSSARVMLSMFGGNHHHALTLIAHDEPFDCVLPDHPHLPLSQGARVLTVGYLEAILMTYLPGPFREIQNFLDAFPDANCFHAEAPPVIGDDEFVRGHLDRWFIDRAGKGSELQLTPPVVRKKIWYINRQLYSRKASEAGFTLLNAPENSLTEEYFLRSEYYGHDATHANSTYGELILRQLESRLGETIRG